MPLSTTIEKYGKTVNPRIFRATTLQDPKLTGLNYPIPVSPSNGYFSKMTNLPLIKSNLSSLIKTERGERFMRPDYGCNLRRFLMEPLDEDLFSMIKEEVIVAVRRYLTTVSVDKLQVLETRDSQLKVNLFCSIRDAAATAFNIGVRF